VGVCSACCLWGDIESEREALITEVADNQGVGSGKNIKSSSIGMSLCEKRLTSR